MIPPQCRPSRQRRFSWECGPAPAGVTKEHLRGAKTGGFRTGRSWLFPDPDLDPGGGSYVSGSVNRITGLEIEKCDWWCDSGSDWAVIRHVEGCHSLPWPRSRFCACNFAS